MPQENMNAGTDKLQGDWWLLHHALPRLELQRDELSIRGVMLSEVIEQGLPAILKQRFDFDMLHRLIAHSKALQAAHGAKHIVHAGNATGDHRVIADVLATAEAIAAQVAPYWEAAKK